MTWNIEGLSSKLHDRDFVSYITSFDCVCLTETFMQEKPQATNLFPDHDVYFSPAKKLSRQGRPSGGVVALIKKNLATHTEIVPTTYDNTICLKMNGIVFGLERDVLLVCTYLPPFDSPAWQSCEFDDGLSLLEQCLLELAQRYPGAYLSICGDLNARTADNSPPVVDVASLGCHVDDGDTDVTCPRLHRQSQDGTVNGYGTMLLQLCAGFDLQIVNGACDGDVPGQFTFIAPQGCSVVDYFIVSSPLVHLVDRLHVVAKVDCLHMPVTCCFRCAIDTPTQSGPTDPVFIEKLKWSSDLLADFRATLHSAEVGQLLSHAENIITSDLDSSVSTFFSGLATAATCMAKTVCVGGKGPGQEWFDAECKQMRGQVRRRLRAFRRSGRSADHTLYVDLRKSYKKMIRNKRKEHKKKIKQDILNSMADSRAFWGAIKRLSTGKGFDQNISEEQWLDHFKQVFCSDTSTTDDDMECPDVHDSISDDTLDADITPTEVAAAIRHLKNNKAAGPDGLIPEIFKHSSDVVIPYLVKLFNHIFSTGHYPESWSEAVIQPIHKKGNRNDPNNYRGISLLSVCSKIYSFILNKRLTLWSEENEILGETQAGFRRDRSTIDHIFTLFSMVQRYILRNKKLYVAFIDFQKAFDYISRSKLWSVLKKQGVNGKMLGAFQSMYSVVKARVRCGQSVTDLFCCPRGLKQGEITSPILFSLFINEMATDIINNGKHGIQLLPDFVEIFIMLFADDVVLVSDTPRGLQNQLDLLVKNADALDLTVNLEKTPIVVFRNGGYLARHEKWHIKGQAVSVVNAYKYLGLIFSTRLSFSKAFEDICFRARRGCIEIFKILCQIGELSPSIFFKLFDTQIKPILLYGSEVWGLYKHEDIEKIHLSFCSKKTVKRKPPNTK